MPGLGDPLVREMRRVAAAHSAFPGTPPVDREELLAWYDAQRGEVGAEPAGTLSRRDLLRAGAALGAGLRVRPFSTGAGPVRRAPTMPTW